MGYYRGNVDVLEEWQIGSPLPSGLKIKTCFIKVLNKDIVMLYR
jgi:hypothetical protein